MVDLTILFIGPIGPFETALIFLALVLLFGADRIPKLAESLGKSLSKFEKGKQKADEEVSKVKDEVSEAVENEEQENQSNEQDD